MRTDDRRPARLMFGLLGVTLFAALGCPGTLADKERFLVDATAVDAAGADSAVTEAGDDATACGDIGARIFQAQCGSSGCHGALAPQEGLDLVSAGVAARVVGVAGQECSGTLADPAMPEASLLYTKLSANPPCGAQMPLARPPLSGADTACLLAWIAAQ
jgi:hypothetical protein